MTDVSANSMPIVTVLAELFNPRDAPGGVSEAVLGAAVRGSIEGRLAVPGHRVSGYTNGPMLSPPFAPGDSDALARDGFRTRAEGAKVE
jgi:hypothetical protein